MNEARIEFRCRRSGNCCSRPGGFVRVSDDDVDAMSRHLGLERRAFRSRFVDGDRLKSGLGSRCVLLEDGSAASCSVYPVRPEKCRTWPFWPEVLRDERSLAEASRVCPGIEVLEWPAS
ncbi:MAG: YkgJ family cysteine cluster protein [Planctomycetes bacterium]|nr:YkgJ family cysteine cluster protein [Planctomycetota bacterium]